MHTPKDIIFNVFTEAYRRFDDEVWVKGGNASRDHMFEFLQKIKDELTSKMERNVKTCDRSCASHPENPKSKMTPAEKTVYEAEGLKQRQEFEERRRVIRERQKRSET